MEKIKENLFNKFTPLSLFDKSAVVIGHSCF